jgi:hypothetical protein
MKSIWQQRSENHGAAWVRIAESVECGIMLAEAELNVELQRVLQEAKRLLIEARDQRLRGWAEADADAKGGDIDDIRPAERFIDSFGCGFKDMG